LSAGFAKGQAEQKAGKRAFELEIALEKSMFQDTASVESHHHEVRIVALCGLQNLQMPSAIEYPECFHSGSD
jgi:hypothetical protein